MAGAVQGLDPGSCVIKIISLLQHGDVVEACFQRGMAGRGSESM